MKNQHLIINGYFQTTSSDPVAKAFSCKAEEAMACMPEKLARLPRTVVGFNPQGLTGIKAIREAVRGKPVISAPDIVEQLRTGRNHLLAQTGRWKELLDSLEEHGTGLIMIMGKGGVGKTSIAVAIARELASRGR